MTFPSKSPRSDFMGNPIVIEITEKPIKSTSPISFHQVHLHVAVTMDDTPVGEYDLSQPFTGNTNQTFLFDVSSCFRAAAEHYEYKPVTSFVDTFFPVFKASVYAYSSYMKDGARFTTEPLYYGGTNEGEINTGASDYTIVTHLGRYSDFERLQSADSSSLSFTLSRKPVTTPELVFAGDSILYAKMANGDNGGYCPSTCLHTVTAGSRGTSISLGGHQYYVVPGCRGSVLFQFVNSRGCIESIRAFALPAEKGNTSQFEHTISRFEQFCRFSRTINRKLQRPSELLLSSGPVDYQWARWWYYEFCQSEHVWMLADAHNPLVRNTSGSFWVPVNIKPSDSESIIDFTRKELLSVNFSVFPDLNGPLM